MASEFTIRSGEDGASLALRWETKDDWSAVLSGPGASARGLVYAYDPRGEGGLRSLFASMARNWRGWEGKKEWESLEGELSLTCTSDPLGHIEVVVHLISDRNRNWRTTGRLTVEAGQLEDLARAAAAFVDGGPPPAP
jgi:hypothetical protein